MSFKQDYPFWKRKDEEKGSIKLEMHVNIHKTHDEGFYKFVQTFLAMTCNHDELSLVFGLEYEDKRLEPQFSLICQGEKVDDYYKVQEIHKKLKTSNALVFHNSTQAENQYIISRQALSIFGSATQEDKAKVKESSDALFRRLNSVANKHKQEISDLLGRLDEKYEVSIRIPNLDFENFPFMLSLGDKKEDIPLHDWGSGTQNRTHILLALLRAKKLREAGTESNRITPIIAIEEPESFLHPSAQAEFGKILRDLAREFEVQVIATTHSPHMLSVGRPDANILLTRRTERNRAFETKVDDTGGDDWMRPFALALGLTSDCFGAWRKILFTDSDELLLVEGEIDKDYFEEMRKECHGENRLDLRGEIFPYGGDGFFAHDVMLKFVLQRFSRVIITFDVDAENKAQRKLETIGLRKNEDFFSVGLNAPGKKNIEGLLPAQITAEVAKTDPDLLNLASSNDEGCRDAKQKLKRLKQKIFFEKIPPGSVEYSEFYKLIDGFNKALKKKRRA